MKLSLPFVKLLAVGFIVLLLMLALARVDYLVEERRARAQEATLSVEQTLAGPQTLLGPALLSRCVEQWQAAIGEGKDRRTADEKREFTLVSTPRRLAIEAAAKMEPRYRGLFKVNTYSVKATVHAQWDDLSGLQPQRTHAGSVLTCAAPLLMAAISDARGIREASVQVDGKTLPVVAGTQHPTLLRGFHAVLPEAARSPSEALTADVALEFAGSSALAIAPIGDDNRVTIGSDWPHPSFAGRFLPVARRVDANGFEATWQIPSLATSAGRDFAGHSPLCTPARVDSAEGAATTSSSPRGRDAQCIETFDVAFIDPVNPYSLSDRAIKYGLLFIALTFLAVGATEVLRQLRVHPIQYLLVGCALSIFFLLLLSLSEHLPFGVSYAIAASSCVVLLIFYATFVLRGWRAGGAFGIGITTLYGLLYLLLQLEQRALLVGSVALFVVLAIVMVLTRRVDWYSLLATPMTPQRST